MDGRVGIWKWTRAITGINMNMDMEKNSWMHTHGRILIRLVDAYGWMHTHGCMWMDVSVWIHVWSFNCCSRVFVFAFLHVFFVVLAFVWCRLYVFVSLRVRVLLFFHCGVFVFSRLRVLASSCCRFLRQKLCLMCTQRAGKVHNQFATLEWIARNPTQPFSVHSVWLLRFCLVLLPGFHWVLRFCKLQLWLRM